MPSVRIISGRFGTRKIGAPDTKRTHPMGDRVRSALFNILGPSVEGAVVLDAFSGAGTLGLEALSRGAAHATFIERDRVAQNILAENINLLGVHNQTTVVRTSLHNWLQTAPKMEFDLIFADPPYHDPQLSTALQLLGLLKPQALMVLSHPGRGEVPTKTGVVVVDNRSYGNAYLTFYRRDDS